MQGFNTYAEGHEQYAIPGDDWGDGEVVINVCGVNGSGNDG